MPRHQAAQQIALLTDAAQLAFTFIFCMLWLALADFFFAIVRTQRTVVFGALSFSISFVFGMTRVYRILLAWERTLPQGTLSQRQLFALVVISTAYSLEMFLRVFFGLSVY